MPAPHLLLALQRSAGNQAVLRHLARTAAEQTAETPAVELEYVQDPERSLPQASADPRLHGDFVDRRVQAIGYSAYQGFVLFVGDDDPPILVPEDYFDFGAEGTDAIAASPVIHPGREQALVAVPVGPLAEGQAVPYALYRGALGLVVPTRLSRATAPRTVATALDARQRYAEQVAEELVVSAMTIVGVAVGALVLRKLAGFAARKFEAKLQKSPRPSGPGGTGPSRPAEAPPTGVPEPEVPVAPVAQRQRVSRLICSRWTRRTT